MDEAAIQEALDKMLQRGHAGTGGSGARLNGEPVSLQGEAKLASTTLAQLMGSEEGMQALSGLLHAHLWGEAGPGRSPVGPMLEQFTAMGYLKAQESQLQAELCSTKGP